MSDGCCLNCGEEGNWCRCDEPGPPAPTTMRPWANYREVPPVCWLRHKYDVATAGDISLATKWTPSGVAVPFMASYATLFASYEWAVSPASSVWSPCGTWAPQPE